MLSGAAFAARTVHLVIRALHFQREDGALSH